MSSQRISSACPGWDLHCHSVYSDGTASVRELLETSQSAGPDGQPLLGVALTDHDTSAGWQEAQHVAETEHIALIRGTEVTADMGDVCIHMLALLYDPSNTALQQLFARTRERRVERMKRMVHNLAKDFPITWDDVLAVAGEHEQTTIGRPHIADALVAKGLFPDRSSVFATTIHRASRYYVPIVSPDAREVADAVQQAGGVSIIAHPAAKMRNTHILTRQQIAAIAEAGCDGLEVYHRDNDADQQLRLVQIAHELDLLITGGSDWHGKGKPNIMGEHTTDDETVQEIIRRGSIPVVK